ncbi:MAG TPA: SDR family NAD(P)-dependent oxidoreductase [Chitinophagaceae bacterium]|nr:SDR family NAD(P)-dependent oxidoreductase [Chitinophagaceae bacterium]
MIVNVSSGTDLFIIPLLKVYAASQYALEGVAESASFELSSQNIKVKLLEPGMVEANFDDNTRENYVPDPGLTAYNDYLEKMIRLLSSEDPGETKVTAQEAAAVIYNAVTDGSERLR